MNDEELRQILAMLDVYRSQMEALSNQIQILQISLEEVESARMTLKAINEAEEGDEILVPVGASSFVKARISNAETAIVGVGNKISVERKIEDALTLLADNVEEIKEALKQASGTLMEIENRARQLSAEVQKAYQERR
ncbi:MAG: prefoldin alpha subunit [Candidatus Methanomethylophilaceae archaeon]|nr:prefoldin alpha subunit [Candidatus Methanomethylophilaceae archaeon]MDI3541304.1 prefoldin alpha subunit [Candidatus Methanomethylophilaceae archaeon]